MWQVIGQDKALALLDRSLKENNVAHAYLFVGPRHIGKKTLALNLAQALNCDADKPPCGQCHSCRRILEQKHADVTCIGLDSKTEIGIDDIRKLQRLANLPPYEGKRKVFIIDDAEYLSTEAANSLLKILEEPPPKVVWVLLTAEEPRLLPTIVSRCQRLELRPLPLGQVEQTLTNGYNIDAGKAELLARLCHGRLGWALSHLDGDMLKQRSQMTDIVSSLTTASLERRFGYAQELATQFSQDHRSIADMMDIWLGWWRDLMFVKGGYKEAIANIDYETDLEKQARNLSLSEIKEFLANLYLLQEEILQNVSPRLAIESLMLNLPRISN
jgi:DNA polymerase III subunit delta'